MPHRVARRRRGTRLRHVGGPALRRARPAARLRRAAAVRACCRTTTPRARRAAGDAGRGAAGDARRSTPCSTRSSGARPTRCSPVRSAPRWRLAAVAARAAGRGLRRAVPPAGRRPRRCWPGWPAGLLSSPTVAFSVLTVVHQAWGARLGGDATQRARVVAWREGCGLVGRAGGQRAAALRRRRRDQRGTGGHAGRAASRLLGRASAAHRRTSRARLRRAALGLPWRSTRFRRLLAVFMLNGIASAVPATLVLFFVRDRLQAPRTREALFLGAYFAARRAVGAAVGARRAAAWGLAPRLARRHGPGGAGVRWAPGCSAPATRPASSRCASPAAWRWAPT